MRGRSLPRPRRLKVLEQENRRLKRLYADLSPETAALKDVIAKKLYGA
jgi:putative transposase